MKKLRTYLALVLAFAFLLPATTLAGEKNKKAEGKKNVTKDSEISPQLKEKIVKNIDKLDHQDFSVREKATETLMKIGRPALPYLKKALKSKKSEVQWRARMIIQHIRGFQTSHLDEFFKDQDTTPEFFRHQFKLLEKYFNTPFQDMEKNWNKGYDQLFKNFEKFWEKRFPHDFQDFKFKPEFNFPEGKGKIQGKIKIYGEKNGKEFRQVWKYRNGKWQLMTPKGKEVLGDELELGILATTLPEALRSHLQIDRGGILVVQVLPGTRAHKGGVKAHDILLSLNGDRLENAAELARKVEKLEGKAFEVEVLRQGKKMTLKIPAQKSQKDQQQG